MKLLIAVWIGIGVLAAMGILALVHQHFAPRAHEETRADLVPRWKAFLEQPAAEGEPTIAPAAVPALKPLKAEQQRWTSRVSRFHQRVVR